MHKSWKKGYQNQVESIIRVLTQNPSDPLTSRFIEDAEEAISRELRDGALKNIRYTVTSMHTAKQVHWIGKIEKAPRTDVEGAFDKTTSPVGAQRRGADEVLTSWIRL